GPNLWRQWLLLLRRSQGLLLLVAIAIVMIVLLTVLRGQSGKKIHYLAPAAVLSALAYQSFLASMQLPAGFRGHIDRLDWLKSLPILPAAVPFGQISGPALLLSLLQGMMLAAAWILCGGSSAMYAAGLVLLVPVNLLLFGVENLIFLVFPLR